MRIMSRTNLYSVKSHDRTLLEFSWHLPKKGPYHARKVNFWKRTLSSVRLTDAAEPVDHEQVLLVVDLLFDKVHLTTESLEFGRVSVARHARIAPSIVYTSATPIGTRKSRAFLKSPNAHMSKKLDSVKLVSAKQSHVAPTS
jgi:hypothetical protein